MNLNEENIRNIHRNRNVWFTISLIITSFGPSRFIAENTSSVLIYQMDKSIAKRIRAAEKHGLYGNHRRIKATKNKNIAKTSN